MRIFFFRRFSLLSLFAALFTSNRNENTITFDYIYTKAQHKKKNQQSYEIQYGVGCYDVFRIYLLCSIVRPFHDDVCAPHTNANRPIGGVQRAAQRLQMRIFTIDNYQRVAWNVRAEFSAKKL